MWLVEHILQASGSSYQVIATLLELTNISWNGSSAIENDELESREPREINTIVPDLGNDLARRAKN